MTTRKKRPVGRPPSRKTLRLRAAQAEADAATDKDTSVDTSVEAGAGAAPGSGPSLVASQARAKPDGLKIRYKSLDNLQEYERNANEHPPAQIKLIERLMARCGWMTPMGEAGGVLIYGHARRQAALNLRDKGIPIPRNPDPNKGPVVDLSHLNAMERRAYRIADNESARKAVTDDVTLAEELEDMRLDDPDFDLSYTGLDDDRLDALFGEETEGEGGGSGAGSLAAQFGIPPFSVLNAREGWWQDRKRAWLALGIQSELGRGEMDTNTPHDGKGMADGLVALQSRQRAANAGGGDMTRSGAVMPVSGGDVKAQFLAKRGYA